MQSPTLSSDICWCQLLKAQHSHEHVTSVLLRRNADVTAVDDSGRAPVDLAQSRWIRTALRQAWNDAKRRKLDAACDLAATACDGQPLAPVLPSRSAAESHEQPPASTPQVRAGKALRPFERSRSLDQPERGVTCITRVRLQIVTACIVTY